MAAMFHCIHDNVLKHLPLKTLAFGVAGAVAVYAATKIASKRRRKLNVPNYEINRIYLCGFARPSHGIIQASPFILKVETWLRITNLDFEYVVAKNPSSKGQWPYVELNGEEISDSILIIPALTKHFKVQIDEHLDNQQHAISRMIHSLVDCSLVWIYAPYRILENKEGEEYIRSIINMPFLMKPLFMRWLKKRVKTRRYMMGYGRHTCQERLEIGCADIQSISDLLGTNKFIFGEKATTADAYIYAHLAQILYMPMTPNPLKEYLTKSAENLRLYTHRMTASFFPDWDNLLEAAAQQKFLAKA